MLDTLLVWWNDAYAALVAVAVLGLIVMWISGTFRKGERR